MINVLFDPVPAMASVILFVPPVAPPSGVPVQTVPTIGPVLTSIVILIDDPLFCFWVGFGLMIVAQAPGTVLTRWVTA